MPSALEGIRVLDLCSHLSGPYCAMLLGDLGADVIKIERPEEGDDARHMPPFHQWRQRIIHVVEPEQAQHCA